jgi:mRNA-degrading endonuclease YafQ of YafQ-DinJ toxin-antitoxin module
MKILYGEGFKKQLKRLTRRYRQIKQDIMPILEAIQADECPAFRSAEANIYSIKPEPKQ